MVEMGAVVCSNDEFGELVYSVNLENFSMVPVTMVANPQRVSVALGSREAPASGSKLVALLMLGLQGWSFDPGPDPITRDSPRVARTSQPLGPAAYFEVLLSASKVFNKCAGLVIFHGQCAAYYECLLQMDDLRSIQELGELAKGKPAAFFRDLLAASGGGVLGDAPNPSLRLEDDYGEEYVPPPRSRVGRGRRP